MSDVTRPKILLVDDIEENLIALEALLRKLDVTTVTARSGTEALEHLLVDDFALALLDVNMPEMDGFQLAELMRGAHRTRAVPIIFVTAAYDPQRQIQGYDSGAVDFLFKPVDPRVLLGKVGTFLELYAHKRQLAEQIEQMAAVSRKLEESLRLHETFVAAVNHDLRNPLTTISLGTALLAADLTDPRLKTVVGRIENAASRMGGMLDTLYDLARTRLGDGLALEARRGDLGATVRDVVREAELRRGERQLAFEAIGDATGEWDLARLSRVASNLIGNALTHGAREGTVRVTVDGERPDRVRLIVENPGTIPGELLPQIFEPFRRGNGSGTQGLGLGLFIVREITTAHGGEVSVASDDGATRFEVRLPRCVPRVS